MHTKFIMKRTVFGAVGAVAMLLAGVAQAALQDRDLDGDTVVDAFYDTDLDITWLRDADVNGLIDWDTADTWANTLVVSGVSGWRLPTSDESFSACTGCEMGHLWQVELGNLPGGPMTNTGNFENLQSGQYWSGTDYAPEPSLAWGFDTRNGAQGLYGNKGSALYAMAVRDGDVGAVPEPETYALMLAGLTALMVARRRSH